MESKPQDEVRRIWKQRVAEWQRSGLTAAEFAAKSGDFRPQTLKYWKWRLGSGSRKPAQTSLSVDAAPRPVTFVEIAKPISSTSPAKTTAGFELELGRFRVRIAADFDADALRRLVSVLEAA